MQTQQSFSSLSTPGSRWRCCLSWCWSKIHCTLTEPSGPTPGHQGWGGAGSRLTETPVWASCRRTENKMPLCVRFSSGQTGGWHGRLWRGRQSSRLQGLCRWSVPSLSCSHPVRWAWPCRSELPHLQWGAKCDPRIVWHWMLIWEPLHILLPGPSPPFLLGHLRPRLGLSVLSHLGRKRSAGVSIHCDTDRILQLNKSHRAPGSPLSPFCPVSPGAASLPSLPSLPGWPGLPWAPGEPGIPGWPVHRLGGILLSSNWLDRWTWRTRRECSRGNSRGEVIAVPQLREKRRAENKRVSKYLCFTTVSGGVTPGLNWTTHSGFTTNTTVIMTSKQTSDYRSWEQHI